LEDFTLATSTVYIRTIAASTSMSTSALHASTVQVYECQYLWQISHHNA